MKFKWTSIYNSNVQNAENLVSHVLTYGKERLAQIFFDVPNLTFRVEDYFTPSNYTVRIKDICGYDATAIKDLLAEAEKDRVKTTQGFCSLHHSITGSRYAVVNSIYKNYFGHELLLSVYNKFPEQYFTHKAVFSDTISETNLTNTKFDYADDNVREEYAVYLYERFADSYNKHQYGYGYECPAFPTVNNMTETVALAALKTMRVGTSDWKIFLDDKNKKCIVPIDAWSDEFKSEFVYRSEGKGIYYIKNQTAKLQKEAIESADDVKSVWKLLVDPSEELMLIAAEHYPAVIKDKNLTDEQILSLFEVNRDIVPYIQNPSLRLQKKLVRVWRRYKKGVDATYRYDDTYRPFVEDDYGNHHATRGADITKTFKVYNGVAIGKLKNPAKTLVRALARLGSLVDVKQHMDMVRESDIEAGLRTYCPYYTFDAIDDPKEKYRVINEKYVLYTIKHMPVDRIPNFARYVAYRYPVVSDRVLKALVKKNYMSLGTIVNEERRDNVRKFGAFVKSVDVSKCNKLTDAQIIETVKDSMRPYAEGFQYVPNPSKALVLALCEWTGAHIKHVVAPDAAYQLEIIEALQKGNSNWLYKMPEYIKDITPEASELVKKYEEANREAQRLKEEADQKAYQDRIAADIVRKKLEEAAAQREATIEEGDMV